MAHHGKDVSSAENVGGYDNECSALATEFQPLMNEVITRGYQPIDEADLLFYVANILR